MIGSIRNRAKTLKKTVILPESEDPRVLKAAAVLTGDEICRVQLTGDFQKIKSLAAANKIDLPDSVEIVTPGKAKFIDSLAAHLHSRRRHRGLSRQEATEQLATNPLYFAGLMIATGRSDAGVAGSVATTGKVIRAAIHGIGLRKDIQTVSSTFLMSLNDGRVLTYADCGVVPYPDARQLADIAIESAQTHRKITGQKPAVAMLSFSTKGSARHERTGLVTDALNVARKKAPELNIDGELQFDAAFVPEVAQRKAPESSVAGRANVFIFPNLDAGNIAYKITERLARASATGPILQGLKKPMMDLSRGCGWQDIVNAACVAILMGEE